MKKIYIAGKVTGLPYGQAYNKFSKIEQELREKGFETVNPMKIVPKDIDSWENAMKICIKSLIDCDGIYLLPNWQQSRGASLEARLALDLGLGVLRKNKESKNSQLDGPFGISYTLD